MATPTAENLNAEVYLSYGDEDDFPLVNFSESTPTTGFEKAIIPIEIAASGTDTTLNLDTYFDTVTWICARDRNNTGFKIGVASSNKRTIAANGIDCYKNGESTPPTLYFDNVSSSEKAFIEVVAMGTSA